jgi:hypothetical protein
MDGRKVVVAEPARHAQVVRDQSNVLREGRWGGVCVWGRSTLKSATHTIYIRVGRGLQGFARPWEVFHGS